MTKKVKISFLILVWSIVAVQMYINYKESIKKDKMQRASQVVTAFSISDSTSAGNAITGQGYFGSMEISQTVKEEMLTNLARKLGIIEGYSFRKSETEDVAQLILTSEKEDCITNLRILSKKQQDAMQQYIIVEIVVLNEDESVYDLYEKVEKIFEEIGVKGEVHMEMKVEKDGKKWKVEKG